MKIICIFILTTLITSCAGKVNNSQTTYAETFFTEKSVLLGADCYSVQYQKVQLACHRIINGKGTVIAARQYNKDKNEPSYRKLTIQLPENLETNKEFHINKDRVSTVYGHGLSFKSGSADCFGTSAEGSIKILEKTIDAIRVAIDLEFDMKNPSGITDRCKTEKVHEVLNFTRMHFEDLTPWQGRFDSNNSFFSEAYPQTAR